MAITLGANIASLMTQRNLAGTSHKVSKLYEHLSSGLRIVHASDDASSLAIAESLKTDGRVYAQGVRNLNDGISALAIAEGAVGQLSDLVIRIRELATQAANGTYGTRQRLALDQEAQALRSEYFRLSRSAEFNGMKLLDGTIQDLTVQGGYGTNGGIHANFGGLLGDGTLAASNSYSAEGHESYAVRFGDFNGDGLNDLVSSGYDDAGDGYVTVRMGTGQGQFGAATSMAMESYGSFTVALGDLNNDGKLDLASGGLSDGVTGTVSVRLGNGDGTFKNAASYATEEWYTRGLAFGDLNADGYLDMVTTGPSHVGTLKELHVRLGNGDGTFRSSRSSIVNAAFQVALGDINGDMILDIAAAGAQAGVGYAEILIGRGDGTFGPVTSYLSEAQGSRGVSLEDVNNDGKLDLITAGRTTATTSAATIRLGTGSGVFGPASQSSCFEEDTLGMTTGDINGDGFVDIITAGYHQIDGGRVTLHFGNGNGTYKSSLSYASEPYVTMGVTCGDISGDGVADIATAGYNAALDGYVSVFLGNTKSGVAPLLPVSIRTTADARWTMSLMDQKLRQLNSQRGTIGAYQSRITSALSNITGSIENYAGAESRLRDVDIAEESANLVRLQILQQASVSILGRANLEPELALTLLSG